VIVDELIKSAHKYSHCSVLVDHRYVLGLGVKINMSYIYKQINENDSNVMAKTISTKSCKICEEDIFGGSSIIKMTCKHMFHLNCMKILFDRNKSCPTCTPIIV